MDLSNSQIIELAIDRAGAVHVYWNFYIAVVTAILAIMASGKNFTSSRALKILLTVAFIAFAQSNYGGIANLAEIRNSLLDLLPKEATKYEKLVSSLRPPNGLVLVLFHVIVDCLVVLCIWFVPWPKSESE